MLLEEHVFMTLREPCLNISQSSDNILFFYIL